MEEKIVPVILAGGSGTRLWPLSRKNSPKQFIKLIGDHSLFQQTLLRVKEISTVEEILIVINQDHYFMCQDQVTELGISNVKMILEPCSRNTAPAIALAAHEVIRTITHHPSLLVLPADHLIGNTPDFAWVMKQAANENTQNRLITFGVVPTSPKTGYGYIKSGQKIDDISFQVEKFTEKPDEKTAQDFLDAKNYFWNSGMFLFPAQTYLDELEKTAPAIYEASLKAYSHSVSKEDYIRIDLPTFKECPSDSIDYAVMEKTSKAAVIPFNLPWSDLGCWASVADAGESDENDNVIQGNVIHRECQRCLLTSDNRQLVATIGVQDLIVVSTADAVLVADKAYAQEVKEIVNGLSKTDQSLTTHHKQVQQAWGYYEKIVETPEFQIRYLVIHPSKELHLTKSGFITVVEGKIEIRSKQKSLFLSKKTSEPIPQNTIIHNYGTETAHVLEIELAKENVDFKPPLETVQSLLSHSQKSLSSQS